MEVIGNHERADYLPVSYSMRHALFYYFHKLNSEFCSLSVTREVDGAQLPRLSTLNPLLEAAAPISGRGLPQSELSYLGCLSTG
jgi:hypothetical protein